MSTKHRNAGGPFTIFNPGLGVTGSLKIEADAPDKRALDVSGSMSIMPKYQKGQGLHVDFRHMLEIAQEDQNSSTTPGGIAIFGANGQTRNGDGYGALGVYSGSASSHREFVITSGIHGSYSGDHTNLSDIVFKTSGTDNETQRVKITQDPALQVTGSVDISGNLTVPNRPYDYIYNSGNQYLYTDENIVLFNQVNGRGSNPGSGNYDTATNTYTASESGLYMTNLQIHVDDLDNDSMTILNIYVKKTSPNTFPFQVCWIKIIPQDFANTDTTRGVSRHATAVFHLNAGDQIGVRYDLNGGATGQAQITNSTSFQVVFMG